MPSATVLPSQSLTFDHRQRHITPRQEYTSALGTLVGCGERVLLWSIFTAISIHQQQHHHYTIIKRPIDRLNQTTKNAPQRHSFSRPTQSSRATTSSSAASSTSSRTSAPRRSETKTWAREELQKLYIWLSFKRKQWSWDKHLNLSLMLQRCFIRKWNEDIDFFI